MHLRPSARVQIPGAYISDVGYEVPPITVLHNLNNFVPRLEDVGRFYNARVVHSAGNADLLLELLEELFVALHGGLVYGLGRDEGVCGGSAVSMYRCMRVRV